MLDLKMKADSIRIDLLTMIYHAKTGHTGGALSCVDILTSLYYGVMQIDPKKPNWPYRDRFILSKGHSVEGLLCILADKGFFSKMELETFSQFKSRLIGHPSNKVPGIEMCTGALGHGLSIGTGMAYGAKKIRADFRTFVLMGDGEQAEGSVYEAAMAASFYKLDNLIAFIDRNTLQISGKTEDVMALGDLDAKWKAFGWETIHINGHDHQAIIDACNRPTVGRPRIIIAKTIKGKGVSFIENRVEWHHHVLNKEELDTAISELGGAAYNE